jgi:hypothetical protein
MLPLRAFRAPAEACIMIAMSHWKLASRHWKLVCASAGLALAAAWLHSVSPVAAADKVPTDCNRACLENLIDQYLAALVAHDPKRLPLAADVRYTENDQPLDVGDGFWGTASAMGNYKHYFSDPVEGQAGFMGTMYESRTNLVLMGLRLRVQLGRITEIESTHYRVGGGGPSGVPDLKRPERPRRWGPSRFRPTRGFRASS